MNTVHTLGSEQAASLEQEYSQRVGRAGPAGDDEKVKVVVLHHVGGASQLLRRHNSEHRFAIGSHHDEPHSDESTHGAPNGRPPATREVHSPHIAPGGTAHEGRSGARVAQSSGSSQEKRQRSQRVLGGPSQSSSGATTPSPQTDTTQVPAVGLQPGMAAGQSSTTSIPPTQRSTRVGPAQ